MAGVIQDGAVGGDVCGVGFSIGVFGVLLFLDLALWSLVLISFWLLVDKRETRPKQGLTMMRTRSPSSEWRGVSRGVREVERDRGVIYLMKSLLF